MTPEGTPPPSKLDYQGRCSTCGWHTYWTEDQQQCTLWLSLQFEVCPVRIGQLRSATCAQTITSEPGASNA